MGTSMCVLDIEKDEKRETSSEEDGRGKWSGTDTGSDFELPVLDSSVLGILPRSGSHCWVPVPAAASVNTRNANLWPQPRPIWVEIQKTEF